MAVAATLLVFSDVEHSNVVFCHFDCLDRGFVVSFVFAGRIDLTERIFRRRVAARGDCVRLDASRAFRAGSVCVCP